MITNGRLLSLILLVAFSGCSSVWKAPPDASADNLSLSSANAPLPVEARRARIAFAYEPLKTIRAGERTSVHLLVTNLGSVVWTYSGDRSGKYEIRVGNHWIDRNGNAKDDGRGSLPYDLRPGDTAEILILINAPETTGEYTLEFDMVQEQVGWFGDSASEKLRLNVAIE